MTTKTINTLISQLARRPTLFSVFSSIIMLFSFTMCSEKDDIVKGSLGSFSIDKKIGANVEYAWTGALQPDGKIIISNLGTLIRINPDGSIDKSFDIDVDKSWFIEDVRSISLQPDGKVLLAGKFTINKEQKFLLRLTATGALDKSFLPTSMTGYRFGGLEISKVVSQKDGKVLISGRFNLINGMPGRLMCRLLENGTIDPSFTGPASYNESGYITNFSLLDNGKILALGDFVSAAPNHRRYVGLFNDNGTIDLSFSFKELLDDGQDYLGYGITCAGFQSNGKIVMAGHFVNLVDESIRNGEYPFYGLARINKDGSVDQSFGTPKDPANRLMFATADMAVLPDDRILLAGRGVNYDLGYYEQGLILTGKDGSEDNYINVGYQKAEVRQIFKEGNGRYILLGSFEEASGKVAGLVRITVK